jgi:hypothetical protein
LLHADFLDGLAKGAVDLSSFFVIGGADREDFREAILVPAASRNLRGSSYDRRRRREFLVQKHGVLNTLGEKTRIACFHCSKLMRASSRTWHVDRHPICGHMGGRYVMSNIVPSCGLCNMKKCGNQHRECVEGPKMQMKRV